MPFGFHGLDLVLILIVALLIFGPKRLPEMGSAIGKSIKEFRKGMSELTHDKDEPLDEALPPLTGRTINRLSSTVRQDPLIDAEATTSDRRVRTSVAAQGEAHESASGEGQGEPRAE
jgi:TatA/E family protein of Tat protein translocase